MTLLAILILTIPEQVYPELCTCYDMPSPIIYYSSITRVRPPKGGGLHLNIMMVFKQTDRVKDRQGRGWTVKVFIFPGANHLLQGDPFHAIYFLEGIAHHR